MKKLLLLPVAAMVLTACSTAQKQAPVVNVTSEGDLQNVTLAQNNADWDAQVRQLPMPENMRHTEPKPMYQPVVTPSHLPQFDNNFYIPRNRTTGAPIYERLSKGSYKGREYRVQPGDSMFLISYISGRSIDELVKINHLQGPQDLKPGQVLRLVPQTQGVQASVAQTSAHNVQIPRNPQTNKPEYHKIEKGFYRGTTYTVNKGDTLYLVAYISGQDVEEIATLNHLRPPYDLHAGQVLRLNSHANTQTVYKHTNSAGKMVVETAKPVKPVKKQAPVKYLSQLSWQWPTEGKVVSHFSSEEGGNKGIDIAGKRGQAVWAASAGQVVYAGRALQGYGNLIIIKHNNDYLSAYAHNQQILVKDKQWVKAGQEIATMGSTDADSVKLHFEVRHQGKSADPMRFLPKK